MQSSRTRARRTELTILALQTKMQVVKNMARQQLQNKDGRLRNKKGKIKDNKKPGTGEWAWKKRAPRPGEAQTKTHSGKTYTWCLYHELWFMHKPEECLLKDEKQSNKKKKPSHKLKMRVHLSVMQDTLDEEEEEEDDDTYSDEEESSTGSKSS
jgi:hypothetical protein